MRVRVGVIYGWGHVVRNTVRGDHCLQSQTAASLTNYFNRDLNLATYSFTNLLGLYYEYTITHRSNRVLEAISSKYLLLFLLRYARRLAGPSTTNYNNQCPGGIYLVLLTRVSEIDDQ